MLFSLFPVEIQYNLISKNKVSRYKVLLPSSLPPLTPPSPQFLLLPVIGHTEDERDSRLLVKSVSCGAQYR